MATQIYTSDLADGYPLTSRVYTVRATVDPDTVSVPVSIKVGPLTVLETELSPYDGVVTLYNARSAIEYGMRKAGVSTASVTITFGDAAVAKTFVFCEYEVPAAFDPEDSPIMACSARRVNEKSVISFCTLDLGLTKFATLSASAMCLKSTGSTGVVHTEVSVNQSNCSATLYVADLINAFKSADSSVTQVLYFTISFAGKSATYYIVPHPACVCFAFRNMFNAEEYLDVQGVMRRKTDLSLSEGVCGNKLVQFDRRLSRTYQVDTAPVPIDEVPAYEQLFASQSIKVLAGAELLEAQITDFSSEPSSDDSSLVTFKFTWRFADRRPRMFDSDVFGILPPEGGIFTSQYNYVYE